MPENENQIKEYDRILLPLHLKHPIKHITIEIWAIFQSLPSNSSPYFYEYAAVMRDSRLSFWTSVEAMPVLQTCSS